MALTAITSHNGFDPDIGRALPGRERKVREVPCEKLVRCKDAKGKFAKCGTPGAKRI